MIITLTAHPSLDRTITLPAPLRVGDVQAASSMREDAGGKGINVAGVIAGAGHPVVAVLPLDDDDPFVGVLHDIGLDVRPVAVSGNVRTNLTIVDSEGVTTKLNLPGVTLGAAELDALVAATVAAVEGADWLVLAGSLPPGAPVDFYVTVIEAVRARWGASAPLIAVDTSGPSLHAVVDRASPDLIKPNDEELAELAGEDLDLDADLAEAVLRIARTLVPVKVAAAFVTLGGAGAVLVTGDGAWYGTPPPIRVRSTVGAGDSSLAGFLLARANGESPAECVRNGIRYGSAAAALEGTQAPTASDLPSGDVPVRFLPL